MNRAEKRRQQKLTQKKTTAKAKLVSPKQPDTPQTLSIDQALDLALAHQSAGELAKAQGIYEQILQAVPNHPVALHFLGVLAHQVGESKIAVEFITNALSIKPDYAEAHSNLGSALQALEKHAEAARCFQKALSLKPSFVDAQYNLGVSLKELDLMDEAIDAYRKTLTLDPNHAESYNNIGFIKSIQNKDDEAFANYRKAIALKPDYAEAHNNLSRYYLQRYDFKRGWEEYDWGLKMPGARAQIRDIPCDVWQGEALTHKNILVYAEQGIGDEVMFSSCISDLVAQSPNKIFLECDARLGPLFSRSFPDVEICAKDRDQDHSWIGPDVDLDFYSPIGRLPKFLRNHPEDFPKRDRFLVPDSEKQASIRAGYQRQWPKKLLVGIAWHSRDKGSGGLRSLTLEQLLPILSCLDCQFVNLQYGDVESDLSAFREQTGINVFFDRKVDPLTDIDAFSAQIAALDHVITVDNSTVHFSGALGVPTWGLLPYNTNWRWPLVGDESLWYSSVRLYRQHNFDEWSGVIDQVGNDLKRQVVGIS